MSCSQRQKGGVGCEARDLQVQVLALAPNSWVILLFIQYFLSACCGPGTVLSAGQPSLYSHEAHTLVGTKQPNEQIDTPSSTKSCEEK